MNNYNARSRNREKRTKPVRNEGSVIISFKLSREQWERAKAIMEERRLSKGDVFLAGLDS